MLILARAQNSTFYFDHHPVFSPAKRFVPH